MEETYDITVQRDYRFGDGIDTTSSATMILYDSDYQPDTDIDTFVLSTLSTFFPIESLKKKNDN